MKEANSHAQFREAVAHAIAERLAVNGLAFQGRLAPSRSAHLLDGVRTGFGDGLAIAAYLDEPESPFSRKRSSNSARIDRTFQARRNSRKETRARMIDLLPRRSEAE